MAKRKRPQKKVEPPTVNCLLLCDDVLVSKGKNKHFLQGVIGGIGVKELPATIGGYVAYIRLSNVYPNQKVTISFESASDGDALFHFDAEFPGGPGPLGVYTLVVAIPPFTVHTAGRYMFTASHDGVPLAQSPVEIKTATPASED